MGLIHKRVVFAERHKDGYLVFADWAQVTTDQGVMWEPRPNGGIFSGYPPNTPVQDYDPGDDCARIDDIRIIDDIDKIGRMASGGEDDGTIGGRMVPRVGR